MDYNQVASSYDRRYKVNPLSGVALALQKLAGRIGAGSALEAGCGTGHWLQELQSAVSFLCGMDLSTGMLAQARLKQGTLNLMCASALQLPLQERCFDLIYCVHAFHHFTHKERFIEDAFRCLRPGGALSILGMDPHSNNLRYYLYDYFPTTLQTDLERFPPSGAIDSWMLQAGFRDVEQSFADRLLESFSGQAVFKDPFLRKEATSQLTLLSDAQYQAGLSAIRQAIDTASQAGKLIIFPVDIEISMVTGYKGLEVG